MNGSARRLMQRAKNLSSPGIKGKIAMTLHERQRMALFLPHPDPRVPPPRPCQETIWDGMNRWGRTLVVTRGAEAVDWMWCSSVSRLHSDSNGVVNMLTTPQPLRLMALQQALRAVEGVGEGDPRVVIEFGGVRVMKATTKKERKTITSGKALVGVAGR